MDTIVKQFKEIPTTCISDAMEGQNTVDPAIKPLKDVYKIAGRAFTVKFPAGDNLAVLRAIREAKPGDILVIDAEGDLNRAIAGDFVLGMAQTLGIQGVVADGVIRDVLGIKQLNFPVFCKGTTIAAGAKRSRGAIQVPISCGGTPVHPGDLIVGDVDGVIVIPQAMEQQILDSSLEKMEKDEKRSNSVSGKPDKIIQYLDEVLSK